MKQKDITETQKKISETLADIERVLIEKNRRYGNSALSPINIFSRLPADAGILQRLDDKISRVRNSAELRKNDICDIIGYLVLLSVQKGWQFTDLID